MAPFLRRFQTARTIRSERMFNLLLFDVPPSNYAAIMAMDGTVLNGAKLVIRPSDLPMYKLPSTILAASLEADAQDEEMKQAQTADWNDDETM
uniref:SFRICE_024671 n=1 Tax=Spodoptera frugiperda TaxID=7108 RepID=A0A2H1W9S5_SPOFR